MARRAATTAGIILFCAVMQYSLLPGAAMLGVEPDLLLVLTVVVALLSGPRAGMATGFSAGVVEGALLGRWIGVYAAAKTVVGYLAGTAGRRLFAENLAVMMAAAAVMTLLHELIFDAFARPAGMWAMVGKALGQAAYNGGVALVGGAALRRMRSLLPPEEVAP